MSSTKNKALFLDRDGVINFDYGHVYKIEDFDFIEGIFDLCDYYQSQGFIIIIITNQAGISKGFYNTSQYEILTNWMIKEFKKKHININTNNLHDYLGVKKFRHGEAERKNLVGITTGLAYTDFGGDILAIEAVLMPGKGRRQITVHLGEVMKESIQAAVSYVRYNATLLGIIPPEFEPFTPQ